MNREEAIETLKANYPDACFEQLRNAVDAAISALEQPEIIRCKDCKRYMYPHGCSHIDGMCTAQEDGYCSYAEGREE